jgi:hypothetical protein
MYPAAGRPSVAPTLPVRRVLPVEGRGHTLPRSASLAVALPPPYKILTPTLYAYARLSTVDTRYGTLHINTSKKMQEEGLCIDGSDNRYYWSTTER